MMLELRAGHAGVLQAIRTDGEMKPDVEKQLTGFLEKFATQFAA